MSRYAKIFKHAEETCIQDFNTERNDYLSEVISIKEAIQLACDSKVKIDGEFKMHSHQRRVGANNLDRAKILLTDAANEIRGRNSFDSLHDFVREVTKDCYRIGVLTVYDISERIGWYLNIEPEDIYLHAGTKEGAQKILGPRLGKVISKDKLPPEFHIYTPSVIETLLCVYKDYWDCPEKFDSVNGCYRKNKKKRTC